MQMHMHIHINSIQNCRVKAQLMRGKIPWLYPQLAPSSVSHIWPMSELYLATVAHPNPNNDPASCGKRRLDDPCNYLP